MNKLFLTLTAILLTAHLSFGQCAYEYNEKDMITGEPYFRTKKFELSKGLSQKKTYACTGIDGQFSKKGNDEYLVLIFKITNNYGKPVLFIQGKDHLIIKFTDGEIVSLPMGEAPSITGGVGDVPGHTNIFPYIINENAKTSFKNKSVSSFRISGTTFNIDVEVPLVDLSAKFRDCWVN